MYVSVSHVCSAHRGQQRGYRPLELKEQNLEPGSLVRTEYALSAEPSLQSLLCKILKVFFLFCFVVIVFFFPAGLAL